MAEIYSKRPVKVQKKSGFDKSFQNLFTGKVGTVIPILTDEVIPNTTVNLRAAISAALPPLASDTFMRCKLKYAAFFVPTRILLPAGTYEKWLTGDDVYDATPNSEKYVVMPVLSLQNNICNQGPSAATSGLNPRSLEPGSLADYLGVKCTKTTAPSTGTSSIQYNVSALPFLAYHKIWNDWFRNSLVQKDIFLVDNYSDYSVASSNKVIPHSGNTSYFTFSDSISNTAKRAGSTLFADGVALTQLRQANFDIDMFTSASPQAQNGQAQKVSFDIADPDDSTAFLSTGEFTISALRAANSIQQWLERNNIAGNRMVDYVKAQYGANLSDYIAQRPVLLGSGQFDVYSKGIYQTGMDNAVGATQNPFTSVGARYGSAFADGNDVLINNFTAAEPGYIMVVCWLSPRVTYSTGLNAMLTRYNGVSKQCEMANPILQNVGNEPIYAREISDKHSSTGNIFGYQDRYYSWKDKVDEVHGLLRDGGSLQSFALQRTFTSSTAPQIGSAFLTIPTTYLDQVSAVLGDVSQYGYWCDTYFDYKIAAPLAKYSTPSLQDPATEHGEDVIVNTRGTQLT